MNNRRFLAGRLQGLWSHADFMRLWSAHTASQFGSQITMLALPLTAAVTLRATPLQMGVLTAMNTLPVLLIGLPAGVWVDRWPKRRILISTDLIRFVLLLVIPALALLGSLHIAALYLVAFLTGAAALFFDLAAQAYLPVILLREHLVDGNARLETSRSAATVAGPSLAGLLSQLMSPPLAMIVDAISYLASALLLSGMRQAEPPIKTVEQSLWLNMVEGFQMLWRNDILRTIFRTALLWNFFVNIVQANFILYTTRELNVSPGQLGLLFSTLGVGMLLGASVAGRLRRRFGVGVVLIGSGFLAASSGVIAVLAGLIGREIGFPVLMLSQFIYGMGPMIFGITDLSLRQAVTPIRLQARVNATYRFGVLGTLPLGALLGGVLGQQLGLLTAVGIGALGMFAAIGLLLLSSLPTLREPTYPDEEPGDLVAVVQSEAAR